MFAQSQLPKICSSTHSCMSDDGVHALRCRDVAMAMYAASAGSWVRYVFRHRSFLGLFGPSCTGMISGGNNQLIRGSYLYVLAEKSSQSKEDQEDAKYTNKGGCIVKTSLFCTAECEPNIGNQCSRKPSHWTSSMCISVTFRICFTWAEGLSESLRCAQYLNTLEDTMHIYLYV